MADFSSDKEFVAWLKGRHEDSRTQEAVVLAARVAARSLPLAARLRNYLDASHFSNLIGSMFRVAALVRASAEFPARASDLAAAARSAAADVIAVASSAADAASRFAAITAHAAADKAFAARSAADVAAHGATDEAFAARFAAAADVADAFAAARAAATSNAADAAAYTARSAAAAAGSATAAARSAAAAAAASARAAYAADAHSSRGSDAAVYTVLEWDAAKLEVGETVETILRSALWPKAGYKPSDNLEGITKGHWGELRRHLRSRAKDEFWSVWLDWYGTVLNGKTWLPELSEKQREELTVAICLLPDDLWKKGPKTVNGKIHELIEEAREKSRSSQPDSPLINIPAPRPAAIAPVWRNGQLTLPDNPVAVDLSPEAFAAALRALREECIDLVADVRAEVAIARDKGVFLNIDLRPADYLERQAKMLGAETLAQYQLFRLAHAARALKSSVAIVVETWPEFHAARYGLLVAHFEDVARQAPVWRAFLANLPEMRLSKKEVEEAPTMALEFAEKLRHSPASTTSPPVIDPVLPQAVVDLATEAKGIDANNAEALEAMAADLFESVDNILKALAEAWLAAYPELRDVMRKSGSAMWTGVSESAPKQLRALGETLVEIVVWAPLLTGAGYIATHFGWFEPFAIIIRKKYEKSSQK